MKKLIIAFPALILIVSALYSCGNMFANKNEVQGAFKYRDIYLPDYSKESNDELNLNTVDESWGVWGHNLKKVLPETPSGDVFAKVDGETIDEQFCFSSKKLYDYIAEYISDQYAPSDSVNFAILPNDNDIVCLCEECVKTGNTAGSASPAVIKMIEKLAAQFPSHTFFTSYYSTTSDLPSKKMPANTGVIVSAMDYPLSAVETPQEAKFMKLLSDWDGLTGKIVIWDYINNFDDYFTPIPMLGVMQRRLQKYRDAGVDGVFINGSGNDYSTFAGIKKAVVAQLLINPDANWQDILREYTNEKFPVAGKDIADFIIAQEKMVASNGKKLPMYEGVAVALKTYLPEKEFRDFYTKMVRNMGKASGDEKEEIEKMVGAMSLTMLEIERINGTLQNTAEYKDRLRQLTRQDINAYNESYWDILQYLSQYDQMEQHAREIGETNLLKGTKLKPLTALDEDYTDVNILTDGLLGIPSNYHNGNLITSADPAFTIEIPRVAGMQKVRVWMVHNPKFKIGLPAEVSVSTGGVKRGSKEPDKALGSAIHYSMEFDVPGDGPIVLTLTKNPDVKTMAIDEIEGY